MQPQRVLNKNGTPIRVARKSDNDHFTADPVNCPKHDIYGRRAQWPRPGEFFRRHFWQCQLCKDGPSGGFIGWAGPYVSPIPVNTVKPSPSRQPSTLTGSQPTLPPTPSRPVNTGIPGNRPTIPSTNIRIHGAPPPTSVIGGSNEQLVRMYEIMKGMGPLLQKLMTRLNEVENTILSIEQNTLAALEDRMKTMARKQDDLMAKFKGISSRLEDITDYRKKIHGKIHDLEFLDGEAEECGISDVFEETYRVLDQEEEKAAAVVKRKRLSKKQKEQTTDNNTENQPVKKKRGPYKKRQKTTNIPPTPEEIYEKVSEEVRISELKEQEDIHYIPDGKTEEQVIQQEEITITKEEEDHNNNTESAEKIDLTEFGGSDLFDVEDQQPEEGSNNDTEGWLSIAVNQH